VKCALIGNAFAVFLSNATSAYQRNYKEVHTITIITNQPLSFCINNQVRIDFRGRDAAFCLFIHIIQKKADINYSVVEIFLEFI
jgi:hypothetical protein